MNNKDTEYYVLIKINNNIDLDLVNNNVQVVGIFTSWRSAEERIPDNVNISENNINPKYIVQGPFNVDNSSYNKLKLPIIPENDIHPNISFLIPSKKDFFDDNIF